MKKSSCFVWAAILSLAISCGKEPSSPDPGTDPAGTEVIRVILPDAPYSKVTVAEQNGRLKAAWETGDCVRVISGSQSQVFTLSRIITPQEAEFTGKPVTGSSYDILYPGTCASVAEAMADGVSPTQDGNGSTAHLCYRALLKGVDAYKETCFNPIWASAHHGSLSQAGVQKVVATLPAGVTTLKELSLEVGEKTYTLPMTNVDVSASSQTLTAYLMLSWDESSIASDAQGILSVTDASGEMYSKNITGKELESPVALSGRYFMGGTGTQDDPYLIATAQQLNNMHNSGVLTGGTITYFRLTKDIDASVITNWTPLNNAGTFDKGIDFDGRGFTVKGLTSTGVAYASFAGVLYGNIHDVTFSEATIQATSKCGVVAGFLGTTTNDYARVGNCTHVTVSGSTVTSTQAAGGFAGHARGKGSVTGCKVVNTTVSSASHVGGFVGIADISGVDKYEIPAIFTDCEVSGVTVTQTKNAASSSIYTGGFIGYTYQAHSFINCHVKNTTVEATQAAVGNVGGFIGYTDYAGANFQDCTVDNASSVTAMGDRVGGFVGWANVPDAYKACSAAATVKNSAGYTGGFAGCAAGASTYTGCSASGNVSGSSNTGGFAGASENALMMYCRYTDGSVSGGQNVAGGFVGTVGRGSILHCYTTGPLSGGSQSGGFAGSVSAATVEFCYNSGNMSGGAGAFVGKCVGGETSISHCIGWHASLPFCGSNTADATITDVYAGTAQTVSYQASAQTWPTTVWNLDGTLPVLKDTPLRIPAIFVGDSITWQWARNSNTYDKSSYPLKIPFNPAYMIDNGTSVTVKFHPGFFSRNGYVDKGISGQNTTQMKNRFQKDVIALNPQVVVIMAGTNDLAQGVTEADIAANIAEMATAAKAAGIKVVLCSVTPNDDTYSRLSNPKTKGAHIVALNKLIKSLADSNGYSWCNYWSSMVTDAETDLSMKVEYRLYDNLHPGPDGYDVMEPIVKAIIDSLI